jgi:hypothetical protein
MLKKKKRILPRKGKCRTYPKFSAAEMLQDIHQKQIDFSFQCVAGVMLTENSPVKIQN